MFFKRRRRLAELEGEIDLINARLMQIDEDLNKADMKRIITEADIESRMKKLEKVFVEFIKERRELEEAVVTLTEKVKELESALLDASKKKLSDTMLEDKEEASIQQILDEYLNGVEGDE